MIRSQVQSLSVAQVILGLIMNKVLVIAALLCLSGNAFCQSPEAHRLIVGGSVEIAVPPDHVSFNFSVSETEPKLGDAVRKTRVRIEKIIDALKNLGLSDRNIHTSYFSSGPQYSDDRYNRKFLGYKATITVQIDLDSLQLLEPAVITASEFDPTTLSGATFSLKDYESMKKEALRKAFIKAQEKAQLMAAEGGCKLVDVIEIDEISGTGHRGYPNPFNASYSIEADQINIETDSPALFFPDNIRIKASVKVIFELQKASL